MIESKAVDELIAKLATLVSEEIKNGADRGDNWKLERLIAHRDQLLDHVFATLKRHEDDRIEFLKRVTAAAKEANIARLSFAGIEFEFEKGVAE